MRNNRKRTGKPTAEPAPSPAAQITVHPSLSYVVPTEFVDLPSRGKFYSKDNTLKGVQQVEIKYMTAREEDILVNQDYIARGIVLDKLVESILVDRSIVVTDIGDVDKMAILVQARKTGYGTNYQMKLNCDNCKTEQIFNFDLDELVSNALEESNNAPEDILVDEETGTFSFNLPVCKYDVVCRVLNNEDFKYLIELEKQRKKHSLDYNYTIELLRRMIIEIKEPNSNQNTIPITDPDIISQFLDFMPALDSKKLKITHSSLTPSFRMHQEVPCPACGHEAEREVPFSWAWFWNNE